MGNQKKASATLEKRKKAFEDQCYEAYKFWWSMSHGMSQLELLETVSDLVAKETEKLVSDTATAETDQEKLIATAKNQVLSGSGGNLWESRDAFLKNEFLDQRYMASLFNMMGTSDSLRKFYTNHYIKPTRQPVLATYWVTIKVDGRYVTQVVATSVDEAKGLAESRFADVNLDPLEVVGSECIIIEDAKGNFVWEK